MVLSQFHAVPFTTWPSKSRYAVAAAAELLLNFGICWHKETCSNSKIKKTIWRVLRKSICVHFRLNQSGMYKRCDIFLM